MADTGQGVGRFCRGARVASGPPCPRVWAALRERRNGSRRGLCPVPQGCDFTAVGGRTGKKKGLCAAVDAKAVCSVPEQKAGRSASDSGAGQAWIPVLAAAGPWMRDKLSLLQDVF